MADDCYAVCKQGAPGAAGDRGALGTDGTPVWYYSYQIIY